MTSLIGTSLVVDHLSKTAEEAIARAKAIYGGEWSAEFAEDTRINPRQKLYKDGGTHWPDRWLVRLVK